MYYAGLNQLYREYRWYKFMCSKNVVSNLRKENVLLFTIKDLTTSCRPACPRPPQDLAAAHLCVGGDEGGGGGGGVTWRV